MAFEGRETLDDNMCNRFLFGRDILFPKVEVCCTFLGFFGQDGRDTAQSSKLIKKGFTTEARRTQRGGFFFCLSGDDDKQKGLSLRRKML